MSLEREKLRDKFYSECILKFKMIHLEGKEINFIHLTLAISYPKFQNLSFRPKNIIQL